MGQDQTSASSINTVAHINPVIPLATRGSSDNLVATVAISPIRESSKKEWQNLIG